MNLYDIRSFLVPYIKIWVAPLGLLALAVFHLYGSIPYQDVLRSFSFDLYQIAMPRERVSAPVVIVDIDERSLEEFGQWPWPRSLTAQLLDRISDMEPAAIALDIIMPEPDRTSPCAITQYIPDISPSLVDKVCDLPSNDEILAKSLKSSRTILGIAGIDGAGSTGVLAAPMMVIGEEPRKLMRHFSSALMNVEGLDKAAAGHAILSADMERGVIRRIPLVARIGETVLPSLSLETLRLASGSPVFKVKSSLERIEAVGVGDLFIPTQKDGTIWVNYSHHDPSRFVSAAEILKGSFDPDELNRKLVLVGFSGLGLVDFPSTALGERVPGVEIHAQVLESIFDGTTLIRPHWALWLEAVMIMLFGLLVIWGFPRIKAWVQVPIVVVVTVLSGAAGLMVFHQMYLLIDVASPIIIFIILYTAMLSDSLTRGEDHIEVLEDDIRVQQEEAAKIQGEMAAAKRFQMGIVPDAKETFGNERRIDIAARMEPAKMVGGDLYDFFMLDEHRLFFLLGDVCGKGVPASLFMVISKTLCKSIALRDDADNLDLGVMVRQANKEIARDNPEMLFVTAFVGVLDLRDGELTYCNAGHERPFIVSPGGQPVELSGASGPPISTADDFVYKTFTYSLLKGEFLCIFSDGITEATSVAIELFGNERLVSLLSTIDESSDTEVIVDLVCQKVHDFAKGRDPADDLTILIVRWMGSDNEYMINQ